MTKSGAPSREYDSGQNQGIVGGSLGIEVEPARDQKPQRDHRRARDLAPRRALRRRGAQACQDDCPGGEEQRRCRDLAPGVDIDRILSPEAAGIGTSKQDRRNYLPYSGAPEHLKKKSAERKKSGNAKAAEESVAPNSYSAPKQRTDDSK